MIRPRLPVVLMPFLLLPVLTGCINNGDDLLSLQRDLDQVRQRAEEAERKSPQIPPVPEPKPVTPFVYDPGERRSPFVLDERGELAVQGIELAPDPHRPKEIPGEFHDLDGVSMVGYLQWDTDDEKIALIRLPARLPRIVQQGQDFGSPDRRVDLRGIGRFLGTNNGTIRAISDVAIDVVEILRDERGGYFESPRQLPLKDVPGGRVMRYERDIELEEDGIYRVYRQQPNAVPGEILRDERGGYFESPRQQPNAAPPITDTASATKTAVVPATPTNDAAIQGEEP